jgi:RimJ/RimL family protein N-acetyltransferase
MDELTGEPDVGGQLALTAESITLAYVDQQDHLLAAGFGWERPVDEVSMRAVAERWVRQWNGPRDERNFAILERSSGVLVGDCELELRTDGFVHVMYGIFRPWRGKGYASIARAARPRTRERPERSCILHKVCLT